MCRVGDEVLESVFLVKINNGGDGGRYGPTQANHGSVRRSHFNEELVLLLQAIAAHVDRKLDDLSRLEEIVGIGAALGCDDEVIDVLVERV